MVPPGLADVLAVAREEAEQADREAAFPERSLAALRSSGLMSMFVPVESGGLGTDLGTYVEIAEALSAACTATGMIWTMHSFQVDAVVRYGSEELRRELLPRLAAGDLYLGSVTTEARSGADLFTAETPLRPQGDKGSFERFSPVVTGGRYADGFLITLRADPEAKLQEVSLVYADREQLEITGGGVWDPMGMRGTESGSLRLTGTVPLTNVVGEPGCFREVAWQSMVPLSHIGWAACWLGAAKGAFRALLTWMRDTKRKGGPSLDSPLVQERLGRIRVDLDLVSAYLTRVCQEVESATAAGRSLANPRAQLRMNSLKLAASELTFKAADSMVQLAGMNAGYSKTSPFPFERCFRDLRSARLNHSNDRLWPATGALALMDPAVSLL